MLPYILRRIGVMVIVLAAVSVCAFVIIQLPPGDYLDDYIAGLQARGTEVDQAEIEALRHQYGLDRPIYLQYLRWVGKIVRGDMGYSFIYAKPVEVLLKERLPLTVTISVLTLLFVYAVAVPIGIYSATHQYSFADYGFTVFGFVGLATPNFLLALVMMMLFFYLFGLNIGGLFSMEYVGAPWSFGKLLDLLAHLPVPIVVLGTAGTAGLIRVLRGFLPPTALTTSPTSGRGREQRRRRRASFDYAASSAGWPFSPMPAAAADPVTPGRGDSSGAPKAVRCPVAPGGSGPPPGAGTAAGALRVAA